MPSIDPEVIVHKLNICKATRLVRQKRRNFTVKQNKAVADEINKLLEVKFVKEVHYPEWLSNIVLVKKSNGKWRVCVNFTDLNKVCPKNSFPLRE